MTASGIDPPEHENHGLEAGIVAPLDIIDGDPHRARFRAGTQACKYGESHGIGSRRLTPGGPQQQRRDFERIELGSREVSFTTAGRTSVSRSDKPANDMSDSLADGSLRRSWWPTAPAASTPTRHNVDLPAPASPCKASTAGESRTPWANSRTRRLSAERTMPP